MHKKEIIDYKVRGLSNREVARVTGFDRDTVSKYWNAYKRAEAAFEAGLIGKEEFTEAFVGEPVYNSGNREKRRYTPEMEEFLINILSSEKTKKRVLGKTHKQKLTNKQIYEKVLEQGFQISLGTINASLARLRARPANVYIRQEYDFGQRLEYDFGEVKLNCGEGYKTYHMAVFCAPASGFRWMFLYTNQKKDVFLDSHVRFFDMIGGVWDELVYDNMRNVVKKFLGRNEKELNSDLVRLAAYYGFKINVTNAYSGNEKGSVERSVEVLRNKIFADNNRFASLDAAREFAQRALEKINADSLIEDEKAVLIPARPPYELARHSVHTANKYGTVCVDTAFYSVPEGFAGQKELLVKKYHDRVRIFCKNELIADHKRVFGNGKYQMDINHYLQTFLKKPGSVKNSAALRQAEKLKVLFDEHFMGRPKEFIQLIIDAKEQNPEITTYELTELIENKITVGNNVTAIDVKASKTAIQTAIIMSLCGYKELIEGGESGVYFDAKCY